MNRSESLIAARIYFLERELERGGHAKRLARRTASRD